MKGRRTGPSTSRDDILRAARERFAAQGYAAATIRQIAADAGVDPALVHYFFGTKDALFGAAMALPYSPADVIRPALADGLDGAGERLVRRFVTVWEDPAAQAALIALVRSAAAHAASGQALREFLEGEVRPAVAAITGRPDGDLRAVLVGSALMGLAFERYVLRLEPLASADAETVVAWVGPTVQGYLTGEPVRG
jgi:AcrR family transcriptional regulator